MAVQGRPTLERTIGLGGSALISFNGVVGAGIFALPAALLVDWGSFSPWLFLLVAVSALLVIIPFTRSAAVFTESGGPATYGLVFGRFTGFELGWIYYVSRVVGLAANVNVLADYLSRWWGGAAGGIGRTGTILAVWAGLTLINVFGMRRTLVFLSGFTFLKALPLALMAIAALFMFWPPPAPVLPTQTSAVEAGFLVVFYAFVGFENAVIPAGETKDPRSTLPRAIGLTILLTAALYFVVQLGFVAVFRDAPPGSSAPLIDFGHLVAGQFGAVLLTLAAICSLLGNLLGGSASAPRVTFAMGSRGDLPAWFGNVNVRLNSPANSIVFLSAVVALLAISGSFVWLAVISTLARLIVYTATIAALPLAPHHPPVRTIHWLSGGAGIAICLWGMTQARLDSWLAMAALSLVGVLLFGLTAAGRSRRRRAAAA